MSKRKKIKPRRRNLTPPARGSSPSTGDAPSVSRLQRASFLATVAGAAALALALAVQQRWLTMDLGPSGSTILKVAGGGLIIAGLIFGRAAKRA